MFVNFVPSVKKNYLTNLVAAATPPLWSQKIKHFPKSTQSNQQFTRYKTLKKIFVVHYC